MTRSVGVIGAGSWGTALAIVLAQHGYQAGLWVYEPELAQAMASERENRVYLPGFALPAAVHPTASLAEALAPLLLIAVPSHALRATLARLLPLLPPAVEIVLATKGLEEDTLLRVSEVAEEVLGAGIRSRLATLSGPTFAREVAAGDPTAVVIAARDPALATSLQQRLASPTLRLYTSSDVVGVELAASLKNVIAIAAGICQGLGLGSNTRAALIARGLAEMSRLAIAAGGQAETLAGLAGLGDLVLTCTGELSRNRSLGIALGQGRSLAEAQAATPMVAEGVRTTAAAARLAERRGVEMPILRQMHRVLFEGQPPRHAVAELMQRSLKPE
ncbi:MAG TPA: NAD(P)H-dependent glycerol-3-phosphate dehydrogenase [Terriglobales bacterium]|nr:NAD(P)H-dependent glycerol-3-phosphate dehydrogenase [Terriglobales bacterium]